MSFVVAPLHDAGIVEFTESFVRLYPSLSSMIVIGSSPDIAVPSVSAIELSGERTDEALSGHDVRGELVSPMFGSIDSGVIPDNVAAASLDEGEPSYDPSFNAFELEGEGIDEALSILDIEASNSITGAIQYLALASIAAKFESQAGAIGSADTRGQEVDPSRSVIGVRGDRNNESRATLETASEGTGYPALSSIETGTPTEATQASRASVDVQSGESVEFMVDIQDVILSSGHGDC